MTRVGRAFSRVLVGLLVAALRIYKVALSPLLPSACRYHPSCSVYAMGALAVHGPWRGLGLALRRLSRCHPFQRGGVDPVPPRDGRPADELLEHSFPDITRRLREPAPPYLAALSAPPTQRS